MIDRCLLIEIQLEILSEIDRICRKNNINYFLDSGTLLGAVRHKGMIPWDDDIDLGMLRKDYIKFSDIAAKELNNKFYFQSWNNSVNFGLPFVKIRKKGTHFIENDNADLGDDNGIFVDIFPYDHCPASKYKQVLQKSILYITGRLIVSKCNYNINADKSNKCYVLRKMIYCFLSFISHFFTKSTLCLWYEKAATKYNLQYTDYYVPQAGDGHYERWKIPRECLDSFTQLEYEGRLYPCPQNFDLYLRCFYGDYMQLPPIEQRKSVHDVFDIIIDKCDKDE